MVYVMIFLIYHKAGYGVAMTTTVAEYNSKAACESAASDFARYASWADKYTWSCMPKGEKK